MSTAKHDVVMYNRGKMRYVAQNVAERCGCVRLKRQTRCVTEKGDAARSVRSTRDMWYVTNVSEFQKQVFYMLAPPF